MMDYIQQSANVYCPYCGENIEVLVDCSEPEQQYIEDCQVCCRPIVFTVQIDHQLDVLIDVRTEDE